MVVNLDEGKKKVEYLEVVLGGETYKVPLGGELTPDELKALKTDEGIVAFLSEYIPEEKVRVLTIKELITIFTAWKDETQSVSGITLGESSASRSSRRSTARQ